MIESYGSCIAVSNSATQSVAMNQPAGKVSEQGHIICYPEGEHNVCVCKRKEADLRFPPNRKHASSFYFHNKLYWKIKH